ncbi:cysteine-rich with EGF-like domain protein 2 isoform X3 [Enhydra lutris kenyoni]|uniref:protein disulfide-isomerase n=1 Tax=Enhydra lutris kenyoni TaxID=391180 RepID=A0A2Y9L0L4_ENHLU|nr:cysteine-rich with EGF-like domain protein 2 isoform X3 [Enhydra lutris kenyoni]
MRSPAPTALGLLLLLLPPPPAEAAKKATPCKRCRELVDKFNRGMVDTAKKNFGGGNTAWEEKSLSKYEFSEVRLLEITEGLCGSSDFECHSLLEEHEGHLEAWWLRLKKDFPDLFEWFCVKTLKVCCSPGTYGPDCLPCQGGSQRPCSGNGHCSGDGSRQGDGSCQCHLGYQGATCSDCMDGYFSSLRNETHSICTACDESCKTCTGPSNRDCGQCAVGWAQEDGACMDVDECAADTPPCGNQQYCENVNGSFVCEDVDECAGPEKACARQHENCYNTPGSFVCVCPEGFEDTEDACVQTQAPGGGEWQALAVHVRKLPAVRPEGGDGWGSGQTGGEACLWGALAVTAPWEVGPRRRVRDPGVSRRALRGLPESPRAAAAPSPEGRSVPSLHFQRPLGCVPPVSAGGLCLRGLLVACVSVSESPSSYKVAPQ